VESEVWLAKEHHSSISSFLEDQGDLGRSQIGARIMILTNLCLAWENSISLTVQINRVFCFTAISLEMATILTMKVLLLVLSSLRADAMILPYMSLLL
jgi:hypothetical protein